MHDASLGINFNPNAVDKNMIPSGSLSVPHCRALPRLLLSCRKYSALREPFHPTHWKSCSAWDSFSTKCSLFDIEEKQPVIRQGLLISTTKRHPKLGRCRSRPILSRYQRMMVYFLPVDAEPSTSYY